MDKILFIGGLGGTIGGFAVIFYQAIIFLKYNEWRSLPLTKALEYISPGLVTNGTLPPGAVSFTDGCPFSAALIAVGLILLWVSGKIRNRYA